MHRKYSQGVVDAICAILELHADKGGMVNTSKAWRDLRDLPLDFEAVEEIINRLEGTGYLWLWGEWIILSRPVQCPGCNRWIEVPLTRHLREDHPRAIVRVEWVD